MANGTTLPSGCYLSVASPPSRDADAGLTMFGWFYVPSFSGYHTTLMLNYATNNVGEGFQFEGVSASQAGGFVMCYPSDYSSLGGSYASGTWYFQAEVYTRSGGVTTRRTYISATAGATPSLISTQTWTAPDASPERFDIGEAETFGRTLRGSLQYVGLAPIAMSLAELATQSNATTPTVSCWVFLQLEGGSLTDSSGNSRTVTATGGTPTAASVGAPVAPPIDGAVAAVSGAPIAGIVSTVAQPPINSAVSATAGAPRAAATTVIAQPQILSAVAATAGAPRAAVATAVSSAPTLVVLYGHSVIAGYGLSDPNDHIAPKLATLLGSRAEAVIELGYSGESSATLADNFQTRVDPYVQAGMQTILAYTISFNSAHNGVSAASIMQDVWNVAVMAFNLGWKIIVMNETKADADSQAHEETLLAINAAMQADWPDYAHGFVNTRERFDYTDLTIYQDDGAHPNAAGTTVLAGMLYSEVNRLLLGVSQALTAATAATAGAPRAAMATLLSLRPAVAAVAGAPVSSSSVTIGAPVSAAIAATAGAPFSGSIAIIGEATMTTISATAGAPFASIVATLIDNYPDLNAMPCNPTSYEELTLEIRTRVEAA